MRGSARKTQHHRIGVAAAQRAGLEGEPSQVARCWQEDGLTVAAVAGAADCGWSVYFAPGSALLLEMTAEAWRTSKGHPASRLRDTASRIAQEYPEALCALVPDDADAYETVGAPCGSLVLAVASESEVWVAWLGGEGASLVRESMVVEGTVPHTLKSSVAGTMDAAQLAALPNVCIRFLGIDASDRRLEHLQTAWRAEPGDHLVLLSREAQRLITSGELANMCATCPDPQSLASDLVRTAIGRDATSAAAITVHWLPVRHR